MFIAMTATASLAQEVGKTALSLGVSSVGLTGEIAYRASDKWRFRGMLSGAPTYRSGESVAGIGYETTSKVRGFTLLADRFLWDSIWHVSVGAFVSGTTADGVATGTFQIGNNVYTTTLKATAEFENKVSPLVSFGFTYPLGKKTHFTGSLGYIYTGGVNVRMNGEPKILPGDLLLEKLQAEADIGDGYPFLEFGLYYSF